jgi:Icc-related predicted phosphoesterase
MKIVCISDTHNHHQVLDGIIPDGDILIHGGDIAIHGSVLEIQQFIDWFSQLPHKYKIFVGGNHDGALEHSKHLINIPTNVIYLENELAEIEGFKIWGSPVSPPFRSFGFMWDDLKRQSLYANTPKCDILINHSPALGSLDKIIEERHVGCEFLKEAIERIKPKLVISGHIHEGYGKIEQNGIIYVNASIMTRYYKPLNQPICVEL